MKKVRGLLVGVVLWVVLMGCIFVEQHYTRTVEVVKVEGQEITVEDNYNHQWKFFGEGFEEVKTGLKLKKNSKIEKPEK